MSAKKIWIINDYAGSPYHGVEFRSYYIAKELVKLGDSVTIVSSSYSHVFKTLPTKKREMIDGVEFLWVQTFNYGNSHNKLRILKWFLFMFKIFFLPFSLKKPDVIIASPMAPFLVLPSWCLAKVYGAKFIYEVKDIWPLSLIELGGFSPSHPFIRFMGWFEKFALKKADVVVSNLQNYGEHIRKDVGLSRDFEWISNGVDLEELVDAQALPKNVLDQIPKDKFIIGYTGTIGVANALESFCEAARLLEENENIVFVIVGDGQEKQNLVYNYGDVKNLLFIDSIAKKQVQSMLSLFDVCYIGLRRENLFKYGVSPNKLYDYMYSAKPILYAIESGKNIVDVAECGVSIESENSQEIVLAIEYLSKLNEKEREKMGENGKKYLLKYFTYDKLSQQYQKLWRNS